MKIVIWKGSKLLPVIKDQRIRKFSDGRYKCWTVCDEEGKRLIWFREWIDPSWTLQNRLNELEHEKGASKHRKKMERADHLRPSTRWEIHRWLKGHPKSRLKRS